MELTEDSKLSYTKPGLSRGNGHCEDIYNCMKKIIAKAQVLVRRPSDVVFDAFADANTMSKFWFTRRDSGLVEGETFYWYIGDGEDAPAIEVCVKELSRPDNIHIEWGDRGQCTTVIWKLEQIENGITKLSVEEGGFTGSSEDIVRQALDSTGGFNQVVIALKALLEHDSVINVVNDHA